MNDALDFIHPDDLDFYISEGNLLCLNYKDKNIGRVSVKRMFPFQHTDEYIAVYSENYTRTDSDNEIGIIRDINDLSDCQIKIIKSELQKRYFIPEITSVKYIKEEYGNIAFKTETTAGEREFIITDMGSNIKNISFDRVLLTDVYGNRYLIPNINTVDEKTIKILEIWI